MGEKNPNSALFCLDPARRRSETNSAAVGSDLVPDLPQRAAFVDHGDLSEAVGFLLGREWQGWGVAASATIGTPGFVQRPGIVKPWLDLPYKVAERTSKSEAMV